MVYRLVFFRLTRFRYFAVGEYHPQFTCNSDANLVNKEANLYFFKLVLFRPYLASAGLKNKTGKRDVLQKKSTDKLISLPM